MYSCVNKRFKQKKSDYCWIQRENWMYINLTKGLTLSTFRVTASKKSSETSQKLSKAHLLKSELNRNSSDNSFALKKWVTFTVTHLNSSNSYIQCKVILFSAPPSKQGLAYTLIVVCCKHMGDTWMQWNGWEVSQPGLSHSALILSMNEYYTQWMRVWYISNSEKSVS